MEVVSHQQCCMVSRGPCLNKDWLEILKRTERAVVRSRYLVMLMERMKTEDLMNMLWVKEQENMTSYGITMASNTTNNWYDYCYVCC